MKLTSNTTINILLGLIALLTLFHILIMTKIIPYNVTWGGRLTNDNEMFVFETIAILVNVFLSWILLMKGNYVRFKFSTKIINLVLWIFFVLFILNTVGNSLAITNFEKYFAIVTALFAILIGIILMQRKIH